MKFEAYLNEQMTNEEFKKEFDSLAPERELALALLEARTSQGITQKELAAKIGIRQSNLSRIETGMVSPTLQTLQKIAEGLGKKLIIQLK